MKKERYKKVPCSKCKEQVGENNIKRHEVKCDGTGSFYDCVNCKKVSKKGVTKANKFCSLKCMGEYRQAHPLKYNLQNKRISQFSDPKLLEQIYEYYSTGKGLKDCIKYFNLKITYDYLNSKLKEFNYKLRTRTETQNLFRQQGRYLRRKVTNINTKEYWTKEKREQHSIRMLQVVKDHPEIYALKPYFTRVKSYLVSNHTGEQISVRGLYELDFANYLNSQNIKWDKVTKGFHYIHNENNHQYFPDFFLPELNLYIEIKGRVVEKDVSKYLMFPHKLLYLFDDEIKAIRNGNYNLYKEIENLSKRNYPVILKETILSYKRS